MVKQKTNRLYIYEGFKKKVLVDAFVSFAVDDRVNIKIQGSLFITDGKCVTA